MTISFEGKENISTQSFEIVLQVVILLLSTIFGPHFFGTLRAVVASPPDWKDWKQVTGCILLILFSPVHLYVESFKLTFLDLKLKLHPDDQSLILEREELKKDLYLLIKLELGLETVYQLAGQTILLLMAYSETSTQSGLKTMFKVLLDWRGLLLITASILISFYSCITSHWKALTACREYFPAKSRIISSFYSLFGCLTRVTAIIMFFTVPLGLFSLLRHHQGEQLPWDTKILDLVNLDGTMILGNNKPFKWISVDRWNKVGSPYQQHENGTLILDEDGNLTPNPDHLVSPPDFTLYIGLSPRYYLLIFFASIGIHMIVIFVTKCKLSEDFWKSFNLLEKIIHCLENTNLPYNTKEWDDGKGDASEHKKRMRSNWFEVLAVIIINGIFNLLLLVPLIYLVSKMKERHDILANTIGYLPQEEEALKTGYHLLIGSLSMVIIGTILEVLFFWLYNGSCHPFANILIVSSNNCEFKTKRIAKD